MANELSLNLQDAAINPAAKALPAAASSSTSTASIDLENSDPFLAEVEFEISAPVLGTTPLPDDKTLTYKVEESSDDSTFTTLYDSVLVQTGAGGTGAAAAKRRFRLPAAVLQFIRVTATTGSGTGDASGNNFTLTANF